MRRVKFFAIAAIAALLSTPTIADSEYDAYAMMVGLTAYPSICNESVPEKELSKAMNAKAKRLGFDVANADNATLIVLSAAKLIETSFELQKTDPAKVTRYCAEAKKMIAGLLASHER